MDVVDPSTAAAVTAHAAKTLLERWREARNGWRALKPRKTTRVPVPELVHVRNDDLRYELAGRILAQGSPAEDHQPSGENTYDYTRFVEFVELPSAFDALDVGVDEEGEPLPLRKFTHDLGMTVVDFTFDPEQDLMVLVQRVE